MCGLHIAMLQNPGLGFMWFVHCHVTEPRARVCVFEHFHVTLHNARVLWCVHCHVTEPRGRVCVV